MNATISIWQQQKLTGQHGLFGELDRAQNHVELDGDPEGPDGCFDWVRVESLMGEQFHLDPDRTAKLPTIRKDDTVQQITRKAIGYVARTQDLSGVPDAEIAELCGFYPHPNPPDVSRVRAMFKLLDDEPLVVAVDTQGNDVYLSVGSAFDRTGHFSERRTGKRYMVGNVAQEVVMAQFERDFAAQHPEFEPAEVARFMSKVGDKDFGGKRWASLWDEARYSQDVTAAAVAGMILSGDRDAIQAVAGCDSPEQLREFIARLEPEQVMDAIGYLPKGSGTVIRGSGTAEHPDVWIVPYDPGGNPRFGSMLYPHTLAAELDGTSQRAKRASLNRAYRSFVLEVLQAEEDSALNRKYVRDHHPAHTATVFEQKKHVPQSHLDAAERGVFGRSGDFRHVEIDADTDLPRLSAVEREYVHLRRYLPRTGKAPALRFRKTGRHQANGVYHPHADNVAVDPRHPDAFVHEFIHHVDHTAGGKNLSAGDDFLPILREAQQAIARSNDPALKQKFDYWRTPTEVLSRTAELYFSWKHPDTSLNGDASKYATNPAYTTLEPLKDQIVAFWDKKLGELGAEVPGS